jgi:putative endonuclease
MRNNYFVYILTNRTHTLYIGVTDDLEQRLEEHRAGFASAFTAKYKIHRLVYFEQFDYIVVCHRASETTQGMAAAEEDRSD